MLDAQEITSLVGKMWTIHQTELAKFDRIHDYLTGKLGRPSLPEDADEEVREIWRICIYNVLTLVQDAFTQNLSVVGFRSGGSSGNAGVWDLWQRNQMDARQAEIYSDAVEFGVSYVVVEPGKKYPVFRPRSPRQLIAVYRDPSVDRWPQYALETWVDSSEAEPRRKGLFIDDEYTYPLDLGPVSTPIRDEGEKITKVTISLSENSFGDPKKHGARVDGEKVCPVVRYVNRRDSEDLVEGEIERLIDDQRTINEVNFDRLIVARFGAFPQNVIAGWTGSRAELLSASMRKTWTFDDPDVKASRLPAATLEPYDGLIEKLEEHVANRAQISPTYINAKFINVSTDAVAAGEANQQRKLDAMRESHGESHEQLLALGSAMSTNGQAEFDPAAEVVWKVTEARAFAAVVDGIYKLADAVSKGLPIEPFLPLVPGLTQQMITEIKRSAQPATVTSLIAALRPAAATAGQDQQVSALANRTTPAETPALAG